MNSQIQHCGSVISGRSQAEANHIQINHTQSTGRQGLREKSQNQPEK